MGTFKDEEIFNTISRDMKDTGPGGDKIGDDEFAVPTMPTFQAYAFRRGNLEHCRICAVAARQEVGV